MLEDLQIRQYSPITIRVYLHSVAEFARHFGTSPDRLRAEHIRQYQLFLIKEKTVSQSTVVQLVCALRFLYTHTLHRKISIERIPFPRRKKKLPLILSREEMKALLEAPGNLRDRNPKGGGAGGQERAHDGSSGFLGGRSFLSLHVPGNRWAWLHQSSCSL